jgi:hypothetical protein
MKYVAKPNLNNNTGLKAFLDIKEAVKYLEDTTGHKMDFVKDRKTGDAVYDWEIIGKLKRVAS